MSKNFFLLLIFVCAFSAMGQTSSSPDITEGSLFAFGKGGKELGECPLKSTKVTTDISGFLARVRVTQEFENSFVTPIEAVYTFPLSQNGAVDDMTMTVGQRVIHGKIMKRQEARAVYDAAKSAGQTASLLDQERPNIFTQSVANIMPGDKVTVEISYVETLKYEDGAYEFVFPMTVAPRYIPSMVNDAAKIRPPYSATRNGSDISIDVNLNAGVPVESIRSTSHDITQVNFAPNNAKVSLKDERTIPNKDFILRYDVSGGRIEDAVLAHHDDRGGFFTLILQPPDKFTTEDRTPKEIVFVLDTSGSMSGFPIEKAKEAMKMSIDGLYPDDTFNLITFSGDTAILFDGPVPATEANVEMAKAFIDSRQGSGGTEMMKAIKAALDPSDAKDHLRIVCFMTDGEVGNDDEIIAEVQRHPQARVFSFGIGSSVNRYLLDKIAEQGRGEAEYVSLTDDGSAAAKRFYERVRTPLLTDLSIDWNGMPVSDVYPSKLTDLFSAKPVIVHGRYTKPFNGSIKLRGLVAGQPYERQIAVNLPENETANDSLASLWARTRIDELSNDKLLDAGGPRAAAIEKQITDLALNYRLMTNYTSFVAVEDRIVNQNGKPVTIQVPIQVPEGMDPVMSGAATETVAVTGGGGGGGGIATRSIQSLPSSGRNTAQLMTISPSAASRNIKTKRRSGSGSGVGYGSGNGSGSGYGNGTGSGAGEPPRAIAAVTTPLNIQSKPAAQYSEESRQAQVQGTVILKVTLLANGTIGDITPISRLGYGLTEQAIAAAKQITFEPRKVNGVPQTSVVTVEYDFSGPPVEPRFIGLGDPGSKQEPETETTSPEFNRQMRLKTKLHTWLYSLVTRIAVPNANPSEYETRFVQDGKATLQLDVSSLNDSVRKKLTAAGFEIVSEKGKRVTGRIAIEKLAALADIDEVKLILPVVN